jgi:hypothetical protein
MSVTQRKIIDLSTINLAPVVEAAAAFLDAKCDFAEIAGREKSGPSHALMNLHRDAVDKLYILRCRLTEAGLYDLSRRPDRAGAYDGPILRMQGRAGDPRLEVCKQTDYLRSGVAELWKQVRPYFHEQGREYEFFMDADEVKRFCFNDAAVKRVEIATHRLRAAMGLTPKAPPASGGDNSSDNPKKTKKRGPRGPYNAARNEAFFRGVEEKVRTGWTKQEAIEELAEELREKASTIKGVYYRTQRERRKPRQPRRRSQ